MLSIGFQVKKLKKIQNKTNMFYFDELSQISSQKIKKKFKTKQTWSSLMSSAKINPAVQAIGFQAD